MEVVVLPDPGLELGEDFGQCGDGVAYALDAGAGFASYLWSTGETSQTITVTEPGVYGVTVNAGGCFAEDEVEVLATAVQPIDLGPDVTLCGGEIMVLDAGAGYNDYTWQDGSTGPLYTAFEAGTYVVSASFPCYASDTLVVEGCGEGIGLAVDAVEQWDFRAFPVPSQGTIYMEWNPSLRAMGWSMLALSGQIVAQGSVDGHGRGSAHIEVAPGAYVLQLETARGPRRARLIIE